MGQDRGKSALVTVYCCCALAGRSSAVFVIPSV
jgi:hypothetical protein